MTKGTGTIDEVHLIDLFGMLADDAYFGSAVNFLTALTKLDIPDIQVTLDLTGARVLEFFSSDAGEEVRKY